MATYTYPDSKELMAIESSKLETLALSSPVFSILPIRQSSAWKIIWTIEGYLGGLQQLRGLDVADQHVERFGLTDMEIDGAVYGEHMSIRETELTRRAQNFYPGMGGGRIDVADLVLNLQDQLMDRYFRALNYNAWTLLATGSLAVADKHGAGGYRYSDANTILTYDASTWGTAATATPLLDLRTAALLGRGLKANFGRAARAFANLNTIYKMLANTNANDLGGKTAPGFQTVTSLPDANNIFVANDLPAITAVEDGYYDTSNVFHLFIPDDKVVVVSAGLGDSGPVGEYRMVMQTVTDKGGAPSPYMFVKDTTTDPAGPSVPPRIEVHAGHIGAPILFRPYRVLVLDVS